MDETDNPFSFEIPDYERNWTKLKGQIPVLPPRDWKETLDKVAVGWQEGGNRYKESKIGFIRALALPNIPELERRDASECRDDLNISYKGFFEGIKAINSDERLKWSQMRDLADKAEILTNTGKRADEQVMALLTAISETHTEGRTEEEIRQKIAQHAFEEIFQTGNYRVLEWTGANEGDEVLKRSTQDYFESEKGELIAVLKSDLWKPEKEKAMRKVYRAWKKIAVEGDNNINPDVASSLEELWKAARGKDVSKKSSLTILQLAEDIYQGLEEGEGFDVDLNYSDEDEEEDAEEE